MRLLCVFLLVCAAAAAHQAPAPARLPDDVSGMYTFLLDGEFVQISVQDGRLTGFISRYADGGKSSFLDHFFTDTKIDGNRFWFKTKTVHGVWFEFKGNLERGPGKSHAEEAYYVVRGTLTQNTEDAAKKVSAQTREITFKSFPEEAESEPPPKK